MPTRPHHAIFIVVTAVVGLTLNGCGDKKKSTAPVDLPEPKRGTPEELLESWFANAYSKKDSARYEEMLDAEFRFEFLFADAESLRARPDGGGIEPGQTYWGRSSDLRSTRAMFRLQNVGQIALDIRAAAPVADTTVCAGCREVQAEITLEVTTNPTSVDPLIFIVLSAQVFIVRPDVADSTKWVIFRQYDREGPAARRTSSMTVGEIARGAGTENTSWGKVKGLYQ